MSIPVITHDFQLQLERLINEHSLEGICNIPDFMLADLICRQLETVARTVNQRDKWFNFTPFEEKSVESDLGPDVPEPVCPPNTSSGEWETNLGDPDFNDWESTPLKPQSSKN